MTCEDAKYVSFLMLNICSSVGIVLSNKLVMQSWPYAMALTCSHQMVAGVILTIRQGSLRPSKPMPLWANIWFSVLAIAAIYVQNLSLRLNTVTLYQVTKLLTAPTQCLWQYLAKGKTDGADVYGSMLFLALGVALCTVTELSFGATATGVFVALLSVIVVVIEQSEIGRMKAMFKVESEDFLHSNTFHRIFGSLSLILLAERGAFQGSANMTGYTYCTLFLSCLFAMGINVTVVALIGQFGPGTVAVVGHLKTVLIVSLGFVFYPPPLDVGIAKYLTSICIALGGALRLLFQTLIALQVIKTTDKGDLESSFQERRRLHLKLSGLQSKGA